MYVILLGFSHGKKLEMELDGKIDMPYRGSNFLSWITNSHSITVKHKYTNLDDFVVTHIWDGQTVINIIATERSNRVR